MERKWRWSIGEINRARPDPPRKQWLRSANLKKNYIRYANFHQVRKNKRSNMIHLNWWCRDQNFRKYFEMRKKNDIKPSISGFYHEPIYADTMKRNQAWANLRASQASR